MRSMMRQQSDNFSETRFNSGERERNKPNQQNEINIPQPKRGRKSDRRVDNQIKQKKKSQTASRLVKGVNVKGDNYERYKHNELKQQYQNHRKQSINVLIQGKDEGRRQSHHLGRKNNVGEVLSYFLGEESFYRGDKLQEPLKTVYQWQNEEISRLVADPNLGDYIIKLPNPDNIDEKIFTRRGSGQGQNWIEYQQALQCYSEMFETEGLSRFRYERELEGFAIAYYLLELEQTLERCRQYIAKCYEVQMKDSGEYFDFVDKEVKLFALVFGYYRSIESVGLEGIVAIKKGFVDELTKVFDEYLAKRAQKKSKEDRTSIDGRCEQNDKKYQTGLNMDVLLKEYRKRAISTEQELNKHRNNIYHQFLMPFVLKLLENLNSQQFGYDFQVSQFQQAKNKYIFLTLLNSVGQVASFFTYFYPHAAGKFEEFVKREFAKYGSKRNMFKGGCLQKRPSGESLLWVNNKGRPKDVSTLLRNCLIYQLSQKCLFRVRTFLSRNEKYLIVVIKASQQVLEYYAQKNEISMQIQIGATDIFSFEPVDGYNRPLRLNSYIRDEEFIGKYSLRANKLDKDQESDGKSIQSEALNIYKKGEKMNPDELRAKIILDQQDCDECMRWVSNRLNLPYINEPNIMTNSQNQEQIDRQTWECYYVYNKLLIAFVNRLRRVVEAKSKSVENQRFLQEVEDNLGLLLRLIFIKAIAMVNDFFHQSREKRGLFSKRIENLFVSKRKLKNIWDRLDIRQPTGYSQYVKNAQFEKLWRKYEINQNKTRSKFFPAERLNIANKIINKYINIARSIEKRHIIAYYPLHDPFILKGIKIEPYLLAIKRKTGPIGVRKQVGDSPQSQTYNIYSLYESKYTASDFTKLSVSQKLSVKNSLFRYFSVETVRFYCGEKVAFYFQFIRYLTRESFPYLIPCFLIQIFLWIEQTQILTRGESGLRYFNDVLVFILTLFNMFWTTNTVQRWKVEEKNLGEKFGVSKMSEKDEKRVTFVGSYRRNFETDEMNEEYVPGWASVLKLIVGIVANILYLTFVSLVIIEIFILKSVLFQRGYSQSTVNGLPAILIAIAVQVFSYVYIFLIRLITMFENHKTISMFEQSLISKSYTITFVITFLSIFIYAFFSAYLDSEYLCIIKTTETKQMYILNYVDRIYDCSYFVSSQLLSFVLIDLFFTMVAAVWPYCKFRLKQIKEAREEQGRTNFYFNKFEAIDDFIEEQDKMHSFMFNQEIDNTWIGYMNLIILWTALALFGPALPFVYVMVFISGVVRLHASKYEIIFLARRSIPVKTNSISWWLVVMEILSIISIVTNIAYMIFTRQIFSQNQTQIFFFFVVVSLMFKFYLLTQYDQSVDVMGQRNKRKVNNVLFKKSSMNYSFDLSLTNVDIVNVKYDQVSLKRFMPKVSKPNVSFKNNLKQK